MIEGRVLAVVRAACPGADIVFGNLAEKGTWTLRFPSGATAEQRAAAQAVIDAVDVSKEIQKAVLLAELVQIDLDTFMSRGDREDILIGGIAWKRQDKQLTNLIAAIRAIGAALGSSVTYTDADGNVRAVENFTIEPSARVPDLTQNAGYVRLNDTENLAKAKRATLAALG